MMGDESENRNERYLERQSSKMPTRKQKSILLMLLEMKGKLNVITLNPRDYFITHSSQKSTFPHLNDKNNFISLPWLSNQTPSLSV